MADAFAECNCHMADAYGLHALVAFIAHPRSDIGWLPYPSPARLGLTPTATVGDLVTSTHGN
jgi:hypothetical protein